MRGRRVLDTAPNDGPAEEKMRAELEDFREMIRRYDERVEELEEENERLRDRIAELGDRPSSNRESGSAETSLVLDPDKHTKRTVRFEEEESRGHGAILGKLYVNTSWLSDVDST